MMKYLFVAPIAIFLLSACSSQPEIEIPEEIASLENLTIFPADAEPEFELTLTRETSFGDVDDILLGSWLSAMADDRDRLYIADQQETVIHLYNPDGTYNRKIGREGEGPGEYRSIGQMRADDRYFYLMDYNLNRITTYHLDTFDVVEDVSVPVDQNQTEGHYRYPNSFDVLSDSTYLIHFGMGFSQANVDADDDTRRIEGKILDQKKESYTSDENLFSFPASEALVSRQNGGLMVMSVPYKRTSTVVYSNEQLFHGWSEDFLISVYDKAGNYQRAIYYPFQNIPLNRDRILEIFEDRADQWKDMVRNDNMPQTWPLYYSFLADDEGRIWVEGVTEDPDTSEYLVLANSGELLAVFTWPRDKRVQQVKNGHLYTQEEDEIGLQEIVKYRVEFM